MFLSCYSEVFTVQEVIAATKDGKPGEAHFVLLTHIAHIEELLVMEDKELSLSVQVCCQGDRCKWPPDELFEHEHATHAGNKAQSARIGGRPHVDIVAVLAFGHVHPVLLDGRLVVIDATIENILREETHAKVDCGLVLSWDAPMVLVEHIKVVFSLCIALASHNNRHSFPG